MLDTSTSPGGEFANRARTRSQEVDPLVNDPSSGSSRITGSELSRRHADRRLALVLTNRQTFRRLLEREPTIAVHLLENLSLHLWEAEHTSSP